MGAVSLLSAMYLATFFEGLLRGRGVMMNILMVVILVRVLLFGGALLICGKLESLAVLALEGTIWAARFPSSNRRLGIGLCTRGRHCVFIIPDLV